MDRPTTRIRKPRTLHPCPQCGKAFTKRSNMLIHARLHTGETPYVCKYAGCGRSYKWLSSINFHEGRCEKRSAGLAVPAPQPPPPPAAAEAARVAAARAAAAAAASAAINQQAPSHATPQHITMQSPSTPHYPMLHSNIPTDLATAHHQQQQVTQQQHHPHTQPQQIHHPHHPGHSFQLSQASGQPSDPGPSHLVAPPLHPPLSSLPYALPSYQSLHLSTHRRPVTSHPQATPPQPSKSAPPPLLHIPSTQAHTQPNPLYVQGAHMTNPYDLQQTLRSNQPGIHGMTQPSVSQQQDLTANLPQTSIGQIAQHPIVKSEPISRDEQPENEQEDKRQRTDGASHEAQFQHHMMELPSASESVIQPADVPFTSGMPNTTGSVSNYQDVHPSGSVDRGRPGGNSGGPPSQSMSGAHNHSSLPSDATQANWGGTAPGDGYVLVGHLRQNGTAIPSLQPSGGIDAMPERRAPMSPVTPQGIGRTGNVATAYPFPVPRLDSPLAPSKGALANTVVELSRAHHIGSRCKRISSMLLTIDKCAPINQPGCVKREIEGEDPPHSPESASSRDVKDILRPNQDEIEPTVSDLDTNALSVVSTGSGSGGEDTQVKSAVPENRGGNLSEKFSDDASGQKCDDEKSNKQGIGASTEYKESHTNFDGNGLLDGIGSDNYTETASLEQNNAESGNMSVFQ